MLVGIASRFLRMLSTRGILSPNSECASIAGVRRALGKPAADLHTAYHRVESRDPWRRAGPWSWGARLVGVHALYVTTIQRISSRAMGGYQSTDAFEQIKSCGRSSLHWVHLAAGLYPAWRIGRVAPPCI